MVSVYVSTVNENLNNSVIYAGTVHNKPERSTEVLSCDNKQSESSITREDFYLTIVRLKKNFNLRSNQDVRDLLIQ